MMHDKGFVLIVDDSPEDVQIYRRMLERGDSNAWRIADVSTGEEGLAFLASHPVGCVLLDYRLPDMDGLEFLSQLNGQKKANTFPVILLTGQGDEHVAVQAMKAGAADYLVKGALSGGLLSRAISHAVEQSKRRREQERYHAFLKILIDTVPNALFFKDPTGRFTGCNKAFEDLVGRSRPDVIGSTAYDLFPQDLSDKMCRMDEVLLRDNDIQVHELVIPNSDGQLLDMICYLADFQEIDSSQKGIVGILLDITSQKQTEAELREAQVELEVTVSQLREANRKIIEQQKSVIEEERLKVLLQMAGATAHELSEPLMLLLESIELLGDEDNADNRCLERIETSGRKVAEIIRKIQQIRYVETKPHERPNLTRESDRPVTILSVEDDEHDRELLQHLIADVGNLKLVLANNQKQAFDQLQTASVDIILLDYILPDGTGPDFLESLKERGLEIPVVIVTGYGDEVIASQSIQAGAYDYLPKTRMTTASLKRIIDNTLEKYSYRKEMKKMLEKMAHMASRDELTGLYNRRYFDESLAIEVEKARRYDRQLALAIFDLDHFKAVNDHYGHQAGDRVLRATGKFFLQMIRQCDIGCRYGGEELAVIMPDTDIESGLVTCERILEAIRSCPIECEENSFTVTASAGVTSYQRLSETSANQLVQTADRLLYEAKSLGRDRVVAGEPIY